MEIGSRVDWIGRTSIAMSHRLATRGAGTTWRARASVLVAYDYEQAQPMPVPDEWRMALAAHEGRALARPQRETHDRRPSSTS